jgi:hypothetical protein
MFSCKQRRYRLVRALALGLVGVAIAAPGAQAEEFVPGVTDFPSRVQARPDFVPGVTDFPSRLGARAEQAARARIAREGPAQPTSQAIANSELNWGALAIGAALGAGVLLAAVALRTRVRPRFVRT